MKYKKSLKSIAKEIARKYYYIVLAWLNIPFYYILGERQKNITKLSSLKDKYKGRRCFIVCNGPSLRPEDLDKIHDNGDLSIGINIIARIYPKTRWRPDFLFLTEGGVFKKKNKKLVQECEAGLKIFEAKDYLRTLSYKGDKAYVMIKNPRSLLDHPKFSTDISNFYYSIGCTTYETIEMAYHLGSREIYLIGSDMSWAVNVDREGNIYYNDSGKNHFYGTEKDTQSNIIPNPTWEMEAAFKAIEDIFMKEYGFNVYNATRGGCMKQFERVDFDSLF